MSQLKLIWANLPGYQNATANDLVGVSKNFYKELFYYLFAKFNLTFVVLPKTYDFCAQNGGIDYINAISRGDADVAPQLITALENVPKNVSIGPVNLLIDCSLLTFPKIKESKSSSDSIDHLLLIEWPVCLMLILIALITIFLTTYCDIHLHLVNCGGHYLVNQSQRLSNCRGHHFGNQHHKIYSTIVDYSWKLLASQLKQKISFPKVLIVQLIWLIFILVTLIIRITSDNMIEVYRAIENRFEAINTLNDMIEKKLTPVISGTSCCYYLISRASENKISEYFNDHKMSVTYSENTRKYELFDSIIKRKHLSEVAIVWSSIQRSMEKSVVCAKYPQIIFSHPPYTSPIPVISKFNYILTNSHLNHERRKKLHQLVRPVLEMALIDNLQRKERQKRVSAYDNHPDTSCLYAKIKLIVRKYTPLNIFYFKKLFFIFMITIFASICVFMVELFY